MLARVISSLQHPIVKKICKLRTDSHFRKEKNLTILTSDVIIEEVNRSHEIETLLYLQKSNLKDQLKAKEMICVTEDILEKTQGYKSQDTTLAVLKIPPSSNNYTFPWLVLDNVQDPGNLGTLMRSALAFGFKTIILTPGCSDPYHEKVNKGAKGANFHLDIHQMTADDFLVLAKSFKATLYYADASGENIESISFHDKSIIILGNEGHGVSQNLKRWANPAAIKMENLSESLNVAIAGSIMMYHIYKGAYGKRF